MRSSPIVTTAFAILFTAASAFAQAGTTRSISVNGSAEIKVTPDEVILSVGVETNAMEIHRASAENDARVKAIVEAARRQGVAAEQVRTDFLDLQPRYRDHETRRDLLGYFARRSLVITVRDISQFEPILSAVLAAGANYVHGIEFRTTELRKHRDAARRMALTAAREKAEAMSAALNATLGAPLTIQEGYSGWWSPHSSWWGARYGGQMAQNVTQESGGRGVVGDDALVPGQISVTANVTVTFELGSGR